jgi:hypothetical protein
VILNMFLYEQRVHELDRQWQREAEQKRMLAGLPHHSAMRYLLGRLGIFFVMLGTRMQQLEQSDQPTVGNGTRDVAACRKDRSMNAQIRASEQLTRATYLETDAPEMVGLAQCDLTAEEIAALLWLRQWYQMGGSDPMEIVRHWEFLKWLVMTGKLEG